MTQNTKTTTIALDKDIAEKLRELKLYSSEPLQGVVVRAIMALKERKQK